jgi:hypothetical protein
MDEGQHAFAPATSDDASSQTQSSDDSSAHQSESGNVDKIREILFGGQMRDYDKKFARLEERISRESAELREDIKRSVGALETFVKQEFEVLVCRLQAEQQSREGSVEGVSRDLHYATKALETKLSQFDNQTLQAHRELRQQLLDQSKSLSEEIRRKHDEVSSDLQREVAGLNHGKTDRAALSALFTEFAMRLNNDFQIPGDN